MSDTMIGIVRLQTGNFVLQVHEGAFAAKFSVKPRDIPTCNWIKSDIITIGADNFCGLDIGFTSLQDSDCRFKGIQFLIGMVGPSNEKPVVSGMESRVTF